MQPMGLYIHIPFCRSKCPYCDFYSMRGDDETKDAYVEAVIRTLQANTAYTSRGFDTVYFGGGTPSQMGAERLTKILKAAVPYCTDNAEITVECNPSDVDYEFFSALKNAGCNRISMGMQSAVDEERRALGRRADGAQVAKVVDGARQAGIDNISLDLMLGVPMQTAESLQTSLDFCIGLGVPHISAYLLKIEPGTNFAKREVQLDLPDEDAQCDFYLQTAKALAEAGYRHYEISNWGKPGQESRHNLKYWQCAPYWGIGPAAHSFVDGKRFYYPRDLGRFLKGAAPVQDGTGGDPAEYVMLRLRLADGLDLAEFENRFAMEFPAEAVTQAEELEKMGLVFVKNKKIFLSTQGFLLSNAVISKILDAMEQN